MNSYLLLSILIGVMAGVFTGLIPGVHINLVAAILLTLSPVLAEHTSLLNIAVLIISMSITHNFIDMIPAIFLGAPDDSTALGVLPGHRYLLQGNGMMAVKLTVIGGLLGTLFVLLLFIPSMWLLSLISETASKFVFWIILGLVIFSVLKDNKPFLAGIVFLLTGFLGLLVFRIPLDEPLLPMLSGLFGIATLLYSINEENTIPKQKEIDETQADWGKAVSGTVRGGIGAFLTALLPGISTALAAAVVSRGSKMGDHGFMVLLGSLGSAGFVLSLAAWLSIEKARNGAMAVAVELVRVGLKEAWILAGVMLIATGGASLLTLLLGKSAAKILPKIPYKQTCIGVIVFVVGIVAFRTGWLGLIVLLTSTALGLLPAALKTARVQAMGCLLLPILVVIR